MTYFLHFLLDNSWYPCCSNPFAMCEHQTFSQIKVTFSFQFQQVDPTRCLQKSPPFFFLQLWSSLLGLASPAHILKNWFHGPLRSIFITMVHFLISQDLFGPLKSVQSRSEGHPFDGAPLRSVFRPLPNPRVWDPDTAQWSLCQLKVA